MSVAGRSGASIFAQHPAPAGSARGALFPLTRTNGAASQHGASARSSACTRDKQRRVGAAGYDPEWPSPFPSARLGAAKNRASKGPRRPAAPFWPRPFPLPRRRQTVCPGLPACLVPGPAGHLRGAAPLFVERRARDLLPRRRLRPAFQRPPPQALCRRLPLHHTSSSWRWRRVRSPPPPPPPPYHVPHPGLRHPETRSRPAWVGAQRPARARRPQDQSAALRPGRDTTPSRPGHRAPAGPARLFRAQALLPSRRD